MNLYFCGPATWPLRPALGRSVRAATTRNRLGEEQPITAPCRATVVALLAGEVGAKLEKGAPILTLEVMKMEADAWRAPFAGVLKAIKCKVEVDIVAEGVELAEVAELIASW